MRYLIVILLLPVLAFAAVYKGEHDFAASNAVVKVAIATNPASPVRLDQIGGLSGGLTNATGPGLSISNSTAILSTNGWVMGGGSQNLSNVLAQGNDALQQPIRFSADGTNDWLESGAYYQDLYWSPDSTALTLWGVTAGNPRGDLVIGNPSFNGGWVEPTAGDDWSIFSGGVGAGEYPYYEFGASTNTAYLWLSGGSSRRVMGLTAPEADDDAANKLYVDDQITLRGTTNVAQLASTNGNGFVISNPGTGEAVRVSQSVPFPVTLTNTTFNGTAQFNNSATFAGNNTVTINGDLTVNGITTYNQIENIYSGYVTVVTGTNFVQETRYTTNRSYEVTIRELATNVLEVIGGWVFNNSYLNATNASYISTPHFTDTKGTNLIANGTWDFTGASLLGVQTGGDGLSTNNVRGIVSGMALTNNGVSINGQSLSNGSSLTIVSGDGLTSNNVIGLVNSATLSGDVTGTPAATTVGKLQGKTVASTAPGDGDILRYTGGSWTPAAVSNLTSSLGLTNVEYSWQVPAGYIFGQSTNTVSVVGQAEYLQLNSAASTIDLRFIKPIGFSGSNVSLSVYIPTTSQATQTVTLSVCVNQPYPQSFLARTNLSFTGSGVATNRVVQSIVWDGLRTNGVAGDTLWFRLTGSANATNWPEVLRIW